jgi:hypothetical protein
MLLRAKELEGLNPDKRYLDLFPGSGELPVVVARMPLTSEKTTVKVLACLHHESGVRPLRWLADEVDKVVPAKKIGKNLLIGTWNVRAFGGLTKRWGCRGERQPEAELPRRLPDRRDRLPFRRHRPSGGARQHPCRAMMKVLGDEWAFLLTDVTEVARGLDEQAGPRKDAGVSYYARRSARDPAWRKEQLTRRGRTGTGPPRRRSRPHAARCSEADPLRKA